MRRIIIGLIFLVLIIGIAFIFYQYFSNKESVESIKNKGSMEFCLFDLLPISSDDVENILKTQVAVLDEKRFINEGYTFSFSKFSQTIGVKQPGFLTINDRVEYDEIDSFRVFSDQVNGNRLIQFIGKKNANNKSELYSSRNSVFIINIKKDYLQKNQVRINRINAFNTPDLEAKALIKAVSYLQTKLKREELHFISEDKEFPDLKQEIINSFDLKLYQIGDISTENFFIASFQPKISDFPYGNFSFLIVNGEIVQFGHYSEFISFTINNKFYLGFHRAIVLNSGYWGKELYCFENDRFVLVKADYSYAD
jgi:hypothetical protein